MRAALRGLVLAGVAALVVPSAPGLAAAARPASSAARSVDSAAHSDNSAAQSVHSCSQSVPAGHYACYALRRADVGFRSAATVRAGSRATPAGYGPSSLQSAYALPSATAGAGQRIYVIDAFDDPRAESDLAAYRAQYGLSACTTANGCFRKLNQSGRAAPLPRPDAGWASETSLDLDMVSAACPRCGITLMESADDGNGLLTAVQAANALGARFVSMSWGGTEDGHEAAYDAAYFKASGVVYAAATGDNAYPAGVSYPATSPRVVAVGGTALSRAGNARGWSESAWRTSRTSGTQSGCSRVEAKPAFQGSIPNTVCKRRAIADVSAVADPSTGVAVYQTYGGRGWTVYGGTSAAAPLIAAVYALAGTPAGSDRPPADPYQHPTHLNDVKSGSNGACSPAVLCTATTGWDGPTGLGTPLGVSAFRGTAAR